MTAEIMTGAEEFILFNTHIVLVDGAIVEGMHVGVLYCVIVMSM
jgi:hypothetical protein